MRVVYAKKLRLPSKDANVLQSLNMALAFRGAGAFVHFYPGISNGHASLVLQTAIDELGQQGTCSEWSPLPAPSKGFYGGLFRAAMLWQLLRNPNSLFYARDIGEASFLASFARIASRFVMYEVHEVLHVMHREKGSKEWQKIFAQEKRIFQNITGVVAISHAVAEEVRTELQYDGPLIVAPSGYNPHTFYPLPLFVKESSWPQPHERVTLVYVGKFHSGKGVDLLLDALTLLPDRFHLRVVGGNPTHTYAALQLRVAKSSTLKGRVTFLGELPQAEVRNACAGTHIFTLPQDSPFFFSPLKLYESLALGLPLVAMPLPIFEAERQAGLLYSAQEVSAVGFADAIVLLAENPSYAAQLRERGLLAAKEFSWQARAETIVSFASSLMSKH